MMEAEHAAVAAAIQSTRAAATRYASDPTLTADELLQAVAALRDTLLPHLDHEETEVMPRVMRALSRQDWSALARSEVRNRGSFALAGTGLLWTVDGLDAQRRSAFNRQVPALFRWLIDKRYGPHTAGVPRWHSTSRPDHGGSHVHPNCDPPRSRRRHGRHGRVGPPRRRVSAAARLDELPRHRLAGSVEPDRGNRDLPARGSA
jgi:hypothetical protein